MISKENRKHSWKFYLSPHDAWNAMYNDCIAAKKSIYFEQYIFENDEIGNKFLKLFIYKVAQGIQVNLVCDGFGSSRLGNSLLVKKFLRDGGNFHFYNKINIWNFCTPWRWFPRTHAKTLLIDYNIAYVGGICIAKRMEFWRDTDIRITGPIIDDILYSLDRRKIFKKLDRSSEDFCYVQSRSFVLFHAIYHELVKSVIKARRYIYIATAFFVPNNHFLKLLVEARLRGVEVVIVIPQHSEIKLADFMALSYAKNLLQAGIKIFLYDKTLLHSKVVIIDDFWATIGSTNMDILSFFYNKEANVIITDLEAIQEIKEDFLEDINQSKELTQKILRDVPLYKKVLGRMARILKIFFIKGLR